MQALIPRWFSYKRMFCYFLWLSIAFSQIAYSAPPIRPMTSCIIDLAYWSNIDGNKEKGIYHDIHKAFYKRLGVKDYRIIVAPYARLISLLKNGQCDLSTTLLPQKLTGLRAGLVYWTINIGVIALQGKPLQHYEDLKTLKIGMLKEASLGLTFDSDLELTRVESTRFGHLVAMLANKRIDAIAGDLDVIAGIAESKKVSLDKGYVMERMPLNFVMSEHSQYIKNFDQYNLIWRKLADEEFIKQRIIWHFSQ